MIATGTLRKRPQGVPDVIERVRLDRDALSLRDGFTSAVAAAIAVGGGQSGGREGLIVQVASTFAGEICRRMSLPPHHFRALVAAGAAAGVAASFNTPVAGAFFALEIILDDFGVERFAPVVAATVTGTVVGQAILGDRIALHMPKFTLASPLELVIYLLLGVISGVVSVAFKRLLAFTAERGANPLGPPPLRTATAGLCVGILALFVPAIMGNGYTWMESAITQPDDVTLRFLVALFVVKALATAITASGRSGAGLFVPSLSMGAVTGLLVGKLAEILFPTHVVSPGAYGMVGMGAVAAGVLHAPITLSLMLFEMTGNYRVMLPLLVALASSGMVSRFLGAESLYEAELRHRGVTLSRAPARVAMSGLRVVDAMRSTFDVVSGDAPLRLWPRRRMPRAVPWSSTSMGGSSADSIRSARCACWRRTPTQKVGAALSEGPRMSADAALADAVPLFFHSDQHMIYVVDADGVLVGVLLERDATAAYHRLVHERDTLLARFEAGDGSARSVDFVEIPKGYALDVVEVPERWRNLTLRELQWQSTRRCLVIAHTQWNRAEARWERLAPDANRALHPTDKLVVIGPSDQVDQLRRGSSRESVAPGDPRG